MKSSIDLVVTLPKPGKHHEHQLQGALPSDKNPASIISISSGALCIPSLTAQAKPGKHHEHQLQGALPL